MNILSEEQITQLAPDVTSLKSGKDLGNEKKWHSFAYNERALWGEVQGSGKDPYRTQVDRQSIAFKCSCPSRKFPCKHGLGLLFLFSRKTALFSQESNEPTWVKEWIDKRIETAKTEVNIAAADTATAIDTKKAAKQAKEKEKRGADRLAKVTSGVAELERWLKDLLRTGLLSIPEKDPNFWNKTAARMVDAQASGLGNMVKEFSEIDYYSGNRWHDEVLQQTAKIHLLLEAFKRLDTLPENLQEDVKNLIGWSKAQKELLESPDAPAIKDNWLVLGRQTETQEDLTVQRNWLYGTQTNRYALILNFAYKNAPISTMLVPAAMIEAELIFYPSVFPLRAVIKSHDSTSIPLSIPPAFKHWEATQKQYAGIISSYPWADYIPMFVEQLSLFFHQTQWLLKDQQDEYMEINKKFDELKIYNLLAFSGGKPLDICLIRIKNTVLPIGICQNNSYKIL
ncbi:MAG: SWIM zinc finger family protein [Bacteroidota bacterium]